MHHSSLVFNGFSVFIFPKINVTFNIGYQCKLFLFISISVEDEFPVDEILRRRIKDGREQVLVKWTGYKKPSWVWADDVVDHSKV